MFEKKRWVVEDDVRERKQDTFSFAIHDLMLQEPTFRGSASELCKLLYQKFGMTYYPNHVTCDLVQHKSELTSYGVQFHSRRSHGCRIIELDYFPEGDGSNASLLNVEVTDPTVTQNQENVYPALI